MSAESTRPERKTTPQVGFEAYTSYLAGWYAMNGIPQPPEWDEQAPIIRGAWDAAARDMREHERAGGAL